MNQEQKNRLEQIIVQDYSNMAGIVVCKDGATVYERYFNGCTEASRFHVFSVTKSIVSLLIGMAVDKGYIESVHRPILDFFPEYRIKRGEKTLERITIRDMLTMTVPYKYKSAPYTKYFTSEDWVKASLDLAGGKGTLGTFRYAPLIGPDILSGILMKATGQSVLAFAKQHLFSPLDISVENSILFTDKEEQLAFYKARDVNGWVADPKGVHTAGWGLSLTAIDMAKIGQLCLQEGIWNGKQVVSSMWLLESTAEQSRFEEMNLSYGYLWWVISPQERAYAAMGDGGNTIYVNQKKSIAVAITSFFKPSVKDRIELIRKTIEPMFEENA